MERHSLSTCLCYIPFGSQGCTSCVSVWTSVTFLNHSGRESNLWLRLEAMARSGWAGGQTELQPVFVLASLGWPRPCYCSGNHACPSGAWSRLRRRLSLGADLGDLWQVTSSTGHSCSLELSTFRADSILLPPSLCLKHCSLFLVDISLLHQTGGSSRVCVRHTSGPLH